MREGGREKQSAAGGDKKSESVKSLLSFVDKSDCEDFTNDLFADTEDMIPDIEDEDDRGWSEPPVKPEPLPKHNTQKEIVAVDMITRRNLSASQRSICVAEMFDIVEALRREAKEAYQENVGRPVKESVAPLQRIVSDESDDTSFPDPPAKESARVNVVASKLAQVSPRTMADAIKF